MRKKDREKVADILMSITMVEAALAALQETIDRERKALRLAIEEKEADA